MKTIKDFELELPDWIIDGFLPMGHRGMDAAPEGSYKTKWGIQMACCIAAGKPFLGMDVSQGPVLIVDEETPEMDVDNDISRFCEGLGVKFKDIPLYRMCKTGFRFGRKAEMEKLADIIRAINPRLVRIDSFLACLPTGKGGYDENTSQVGELIRDNMAELIDAGGNKCAIMLSAHCKKAVASLPFDVVKDSEMQTLVRGHSSIVGEGCDTGYVLIKISEAPKPSRFAVVIKARRKAIPAAQKILYVELKEEKYGTGWARLELLPHIAAPPSDLACSIYPLFKEVSPGGGFRQRSAEEVAKKCAFLTKTQCRMGMTELLHHRAILIGTRPQTFRFNPNEDTEVEKDYLQTLKTTKTV